MFRCLAAVTLLSVRGGGLGAQTLDPHTDSLIRRTERGDENARSQLGAIARDALIDAAQHQIDAVTARANARMALAMAAPLSGPGQRPTPREVEWRGGAARALLTALASDSGDVWSVEQLEQLMPYPHLWRATARELRQLRALSARAHPAPVNLVLTQIRLELEAGSPDSAAGALDGLPEEKVGAAVRHHLRGEVAFARGQNSLGEAEYFAGAQAIADSADVALFTADLSWIITPEETASWNGAGLSGSAREAWLREYWGRKDLIDGRMPGSRLVEHFRRWRTALRDYRWDPYGSGMLPPSYSFDGGEVSDTATGIDWDTVNHLLPSNGILDDRGQLYMRHGEPERKANLPGIQALDFAVWAWATQPKVTIVGFGLIGSPPKVEFGMLAKSFPPGDRMTLCNLDSRFCVLEATHSRNLYKLMLPDFTRMLETAQHTDGNPESYHASADGVIQVYGIQGGGALVVIAIPAGSLLPKDEQRGGATSAMAAIRVVVGDSAAGTIIGTLDTVRRWATQAGVAKGAFLTTYLTIATPPGFWDVSVVLGDSGHSVGSGTRFRRVPVVLFNGKTFAISDPILGRIGSGLSWRHNGELVPLNPTNAWRPAEPAVLTYEVDGLIPGRTYETRYEVWKMDGHLKSPSSVITTKARASETTETVRHELSLRELPSGTYRLVIRVKDTVTQVELTRERIIPVRK